MTEKRTGLSPSQMPGDAEPKKAPERFFNLPTSPASNFYMEVLAAGGELDDLPARKGEIRHGANYAVLADESNESQRLATMETEKDSVKLLINNIEMLSGSNKPAKKLFVYLMSEINKKAYHNGELSRDHIDVFYDDLVDIGMYDHVQSASTGLTNALAIYTTLSLMGNASSDSPKKPHIADDWTLPFIKSSRLRGGRRVFLNPYFDWGFFIAYYTILPSYYFRLPNRASDLLYLIFFVARMRTKNIAENGYFTISNKTIHQRLNLPAPNATKNPRRDIFDKYIKAVEDIEEEHEKLFGTGGEFMLTPIYPEGCNMAEFIDKGYLKIEMTGSVASYFTTFQQKNDKKTQHRQKLDDQATVKALTAMKKNAMEKTINEKSTNND